MDDAALLELPDDPATLRGMILAERAQYTVTLKERDTVVAQRDESIQLLSQDNQLLRHRRRSGYAATNAAKRLRSGAFRPMAKVA